MMPKPLAWTVVSLLGAGMVWLAYERYAVGGWSGLAWSVSWLAGLLFLIVAILFIGGLAERGMRHLKKVLFGPPPPWIAPRPVSELYEADEVRALCERLDSVGVAAAGSRESFHRDRETGQYWKQSVMDVGHGEARELQPVDARSVAS